MIAQREQILELQNKANEAASKHRPEDTIKLEGIEQIKQLEAEDRLKVLEFLVREMMEIKAERRPRERVYYDPEMSERTDDAELRNRPVSSKRHQDKDPKQYKSTRGSRDLSKDKMRHSEELQRRATSKTIQPKAEKFDGSDGVIEEEISNAVITSRRESKINSDERDQRMLGTAKAKKTGSLLDNDRDRSNTLKIPPSRDNYHTEKSGNKSLRELTADGGSNYT